MTNCLDVHLNDVHVLMFMALIPLSPFWQSQDVAQQLMMELLDIREGMKALQQASSPSRMGGTPSCPEADEALDELSRIIEFVKRRRSSGPAGGVGMTSESSGDDEDVTGADVTGADAVAAESMLALSGPEQREMEAARVLAAASVTEGRPAGRGGGGGEVLGFSALERLSFAVFAVDRWEEGDHSRRMMGVL